jgi:hypothetical protein
MSRHLLTPALDRAEDRPCFRCSAGTFVPDRAQPSRRVTSMLRKGSTAVESSETIPTER